MEGRIASFDKGVHLDPIYMFSDYGVRLPYPTPKTVDPRSSTIYFEEGEFVTSLTQVIHSRVVGSIVLNDFTHDTGLEIGSFFDDSAPPISAKMSEYKGVPSDLTVQQIPSTLVGNEIGKSCTDSTGEDLVHEPLLEFHLIFWTILKPSCLGNGFFRLSHCTHRTPCCLEPSKKKKRNGF